MGELNKRMYKAGLIDGFMIGMALVNDEKELNKYGNTTTNALVKVTEQDVKVYVKKYLKKKVLDNEDYTDALFAGFSLHACLYEMSEVERIGIFGARDVRCIIEQYNPYWIIGKTYKEYVMA